MNVRPLLLAALALGFAAGCSKPSSTPGTPASEPGTPSTETAAAPSDSAPPGNEPGTAAAAPTPAAEARPGESAVYIVKNSGVRCMTTPCPYFNATRADKPGSEPMMIHELDLSAVTGGSDERTQSLTQQTEMGEGLKVEATLETKQNAGPAGAATVLKVGKLAD
ncbi:DUF6748 domain-containing protein [Pyxidicoccus trucidator]|uniref:DUF6748 domain-containing protein n=1 Tax=Pyxidicoccus trucidator TaxID=2709662 RepID=UPI0013DB9D3A|nr:DUF6748 domain-containing protein [Pyxidicoccus trucidator]